MEVEKQNQSPAFGGKLEVLNPKSETSGAYTDDFAKQSQFNSCCVPRDAFSVRSPQDCEMEVEKQSQFMQGLTDRASFLEREYNGMVHPEMAENKADFENPFLPERSKIERGERFCADEEGGCERPVKNISEIKRRSV